MCVREGILKPGQHTDCKKQTHTCVKQANNVCGVTITQANCRTQVAHTHTHMRWKGTGTQQARNAAPTLGLPACCHASISTVAASGDVMVIQSNEPPRMASGSCGLRAACVHVCNVCFVLWA